MAISGFPIIDLSGSPGDIGLAHGRALAREIQANRDLYLAMIADYTGLDRAAILERAEDHAAVIRNTCPDLAEEMDGLASGAGLSPIEVVMLNARTELLSQGVGGGECTTMGLEPERTAEGRTLLAQNWDWHPELLTGTALLRIRPDRGPALVTMAEAGQVAKVGFNEAGLGVLLNILFAAPPAGEAGADNGGGLPIHVLLRLVLGCADVEDALALLAHRSAASCSNMLLGDPERVVSVEVSPDRVSRLDSREGLVGHTNHFLSRDMVARDLGGELSPSSKPRFERLTELLAGRAKWSAEDLKGVLTDHQGLPTAICRHYNPVDPVHMRAITVCGLIMEPAAGWLEFTAGQPCRNEFTRVNLTGD